MPIAFFKSPIPIPFGRDLSKKDTVGKMGICVIIIQM